MTTDLPAKWSRRQLGELCVKPQYGWTTKAASDGRIRLLRTTDITKGPIAWPTLPYCARDPDDLEKYRIHAGDIVISRAGSVGFSALVSREPPEPTVFASYLIRFRPLDPDRAPWLRFYLLSPGYWQAIGASTTGIALANVNAKKLAALRIPLPPRTEQDRIVEGIESALSQVDVAGAALDAAERLLDVHRSAVLEAECLGRSVNRDLASEYGLPTIPETWEWRSVAELAADEDRAITDGPFGSNLKTAHYTDSGPRVIRLQNIGHGEFIDAEAHISEAHFERLKAHEARPGDVVVASLGDALPRAFVVPGHLGPAIVKADCPRIRVGNAIRAEFLCAALNSPPVRRQASGLIAGIGRPRLNLGKLKQLRIPTPPLAEQDQILQRIQGHSDARKQALEALAVSHAAAHALRRSVLYRAFTGRLVRQDPADPSSSDLLDHITVN